MIPIVSSMLGSLYYIKGKFNSETILKRSELTFTQDFIFYYLINSVETSEKTRIVKYSSLAIKFSKFSAFIFGTKNQKEIFEPISTDWQEEYFEALFKKEIWKARWINVRYTYAFLGAMWMKSPIGDLIEFVIKIAKP